MSCTCTCSVSPREELEKEACFILGLLAVKPEYQSRIAACGALPGLVRLLKEHKINATPSKGQPGHGAAARRAADAITNLAHENSEIKSMVRERGGIPPLVALLEAMDTKVWRLLTPSGCKKQHSAPLCMLLACCQEVSIVRKCC